MPFKNKFIILLLLLIIVFIVPKDIFSSECSGLDSKACQDRVNELGKKRDSLSSEIQYINTQIALTTLKIQDTQKKIDSTQKEIGILGSKIDNLDQSLNYLSKLLIEKIAQAYKQKSASLLDLFFDSKDATDLLMKVKYVKASRDNNQKLLVQVQQAKSNAEEQKLLREQKKTELDNLKVTLNNQQADLNKQQDSQKYLLSITEAQYESAKQELLALVSFTKNSGEQGCINFGSGSNGWYYTQRDPVWCNMTLGSSPYSVEEAGCAITSVAMVCKSYGQNTNPASITSDYSNFDYYGNLLNDRFSCAGKTTSFIGSPSQDDVKNYVQQNNPVILRLVSPSISGLHFIVAWKWDGSDFIIHDPFYGPDKKFSDRYTWSQITTAIAIH